MSLDPLSSRAHPAPGAEALEGERSTTRRLSALILAVVTGLAIVGGTLSAAQADGLFKYKTYKVPTDNSQPRYITLGSDGNLWFTEGADFFTPNPDPDTGGTFHSQVGRITPSGDINEFRVDCECLLDDIVQGPDDVLYFTNNDFGSLGRITTDGVVDFVFPQDAQGNRINYILFGIDRRGEDLWGSNALRNVVWRYNVSSGEFTEFPAPDPGKVAVAANGIVWFTAPSAIGRLDPATGATTTTTVPDDVSPGGQASSPRNIDIASDGKVWFTDRFNHSVGHLNPANNEVTQFPTLTPEAGPQDITAATDGSMWFTQARVGNAARITAAGEITEEGKAIGDDSPFEEALGIAFRADPDGLEGPEVESVWFTMEAANKIAALRRR